MGANSRCRLFMRNFSFEGTNAQRTVALPRSRERTLDRRWFQIRRSNHGGLVLAHGFQECCGRSKKQVPSDGAAEIEQPVVVAGRAANEHVVEHLFDSIRRTAIADKIGTKFTLRGPAEGHVV